MHRWASPDLRSLGHEVLPLPTQELAPLLGPDGLAAFVLAVAREWRPDLVLLCPPYDHLGRRALVELGALGATPVAYAFDEPLFSPARAPHTSWREALAAYAHVFTTAPEAAAALSAAGLRASWLRWAASPAAFENRTFDPSLADRVVLIGRPYRRRVELLRALVAAGLPVRVHGHGWEPHAAALQGAELGGPLDGPAMHGALASAGVVVTTGDWEGEPVPMVKYRLLEAALCGAVQVTQSSPDLRAYFPDDEVPAYRDPDELVAHARAMLAHPGPARARAEAARRRALAEHTWRARWPELLAALDLPASSPAQSAQSAQPAQSAQSARFDGPAASGPAPTPPAPAAYLTGLALLAHDAERRGADGLARRAFETWAELAPAAATPRAGLARLALGRDDHRVCAAHAVGAHALRDADPTSADGLHARLPTSVGTGLGTVGYLDPRAEHLALALHAYSLDDADAALALALELAQGPADRLIAVAAVLMPTDAPASHEAWRTLFSAALAARPVALGDLARSQATRWREHLVALHPPRPPTQDD